jgi:hypothetical protein
MIESCANFFALTFVWSVFGYNRSLSAGGGRLVTTLGMTSLAVLAALIKITTFFGFALAAGAITLWMMWSTFRSGKPLGRVVAVGAGPGVAVLASLAATVWWVHYSDHLKLGNPLSAHLTANALEDWNFSPLRLERFSSWAGIILGRSQLDVLGSPVPMIAALVYGLLARQAVVPILGGTLLYIAPFAVFTNLHLVHNYYQYANGLFAILAVAGGIWAVGRRGGPPAGAIASIALLGLVVGSQVNWFLAYFWPSMHSAAAARDLAISDFVKRNTHTDDVVIVIGFDWSSEIAYYSGRRAIALASWSEPDLENVSPTNLSAWTGGRRIGAIVDCPRKHDRIHRWAEPAEALRHPHPVWNCQVYL